MSNKIYFIVLSIILSFAFNACSDTSTGADEQDHATQTYTTENVKTEGAQYFSFETNSAVNSPSEQYDLIFTIKAIPEIVGPDGSCVYFLVNEYPLFLNGQGVEIGYIESENLDDITSVPDEVTFSSDDTVATAYIGKNWFDPQNGYEVKNDVYAIKTCGGNYGIIQVRRYDFDFTTMHINNIVIDYKFLSDGSRDFSNAALDSVHTGNGYEETRYISLKDGILDFPYGSWDLEIRGSSIWLGPNVRVKKIENTSINEVTIVSDTDFSGDKVPYYVSKGWYDMDENHTVLPKNYVYFAKLSNGDYTAFRITGYYDEKGNSGVFNIEWKYLISN